ncbi:hypothetical protein JCM15457_2050 [Liquorilactobacillus sucicola DSM 21376 = JCM 15457]|uniref:Glycosyltransferase 2-like domain-containing protein n=1 Tax=Liquorilactobacillus sucicola DSM 21376 = JCM 15457 TaxID=1423806 RepID=A0A023CYV0_9LACO|nr:hypothetical protein [Liquorilactobacillus sucicola]KRN06654.1 hypothetical protein FD15_GL000204 [Liquorilactobacillus sucicola DSM 21376 = JCM 15457]GAJ27088.1 hypothetical protein JCM15457_2050 [Liquorilactobacillus sucicola DSM 21376 = JCM 15457]
MAKELARNLTILLYDASHCNEQLFKALASINNQIGFSKRDKLQIIIASHREITLLTETAPLFDDLNINFVIDVSLNKAQLLNKALGKITTGWVTLMDSRDLLFADGSLLDFFNAIDNEEQVIDVLIFKYLYPIDDKDGVRDFGRADFLNTPFAKYFQMSLLVQGELVFNENLEKYLLEDFTSRVVEFCKHPLWIDLNNYYLSSRSEQKDSFREFVAYRRSFLKYIRDHNIRTEIFLRDLTWSIVRAWGILVVQGQTENDECLQEIGELLKLMYSFKNYKELLDTELRNQNIGANLPYEKIANGSR